MSRHSIWAADLQVMALFWCAKIWSIWCVATGGWSTSLFRGGETFIARPERKA
jgi:hypothetical protein